MELCEMHVWNNALHIKTIEIWETILKSNISAKEKLEILLNSDAIKSTLSISKTTTVEYLT
jgi:hypothetical protein